MSEVTSAADILRKLAQLNAGGFLTDEEFSTQKEAFLSDSKAGDLTSEGLAAADTEIMELADMNRTSFTLGRRPALDGLRALALVMVLTFHTGQFLVGDNIAPGGFLGVDVFFSLSGFLITSILLEALDSPMGLSLGDFFRRRAIRLVPALYLFLFAWLIILNFDPALASVRAIGSQEVGILASVFFVSNWTNIAHISQPWAMGNLWTLGVEGQFYLVWPIILLVLHKSRSKIAVVGSLLVALGVSDWLRVVTASSFVAYLRTDTHLDGLIFGALTAYALDFGFRPGRVTRLLAYPAIAYLLWLTFIVPMPFTHPGIFGLGYTAAAVSTCIVILGVIEPRGALFKALSFSPIRALGRISYSAYLWHYMIFWLAVVHLHSLNPFVRMSIGWATTIVSAFVSWRFVEMPATRYFATRHHRKTLSAGFNLQSFIGK